MEFLAAVLLVATGKESLCRHTPVLKKKLISLTCDVGNSNYSFQCSNMKKSTPSENAQVVMYLVCQLAVAVTQKYPLKKTLSFNSRSKLFFFFPDRCKNTDHQRTLQVKSRRLRPQEINCWKGTSSRYLVAVTLS